MLIGDGAFSDSANGVCISRIANINGGMVGTESGRGKDPRKEGCQSSVRSCLFTFRRGAYWELVDIQNDPSIRHGDNKE